LMNEPKNEAPQIAIQTAPGPLTKAQKVRSSRYEWESKSNSENEKADGASGASRRSLLDSAKAMLRKFFSGSRGFFDNDDDASPSAA
jgi:hypothetical protein